VHRFESMQHELEAMALEKQAADAAMASSARQLTDAQASIQRLRAELQEYQG
jgi:hypothetical protein